MSTSRRGFLGTLLGGAAAGAIAPRVEAGEPSAGDDGAVPLATTVDGEAVTDRVDPDLSALEWLQARGKTSVKHGCGHGACGACAVRVDGTPVATCLLPACHLEGRDVKTLAAETALHPVQRSFAANDALQCGFCTPGFVTEAIAFTDRWRAANGTATPTRAEIDDAMAGHLCRCGAYAAIHAAIADACSGKFDGPDFQPARPDAIEKVTGRAVYTADQSPPSCLVGRILRAPFAAGTASVDVGPALAVPGVKAAFSLLHGAGTVRYAGQELAALAAETPEAAQAGLDAMVLTSTVLPPIIGMEAATAPGARRVYDEKKPEAPNANEGPLLGAKWEGNVRGPVSDSMLGKPHAARQAVERARAGEGTLVEGHYRTQHQSHTTLEPRAIVAHWTADKLEIWASTQAVGWLARDIADRWGRRDDEVVVHAPYVGGGFGSKAGMTADMAACIDLSRVSGRPVKLVASRAEELQIGGNRPAEALDVAMAFADDGTLTGLVAQATADSGVAVGASVGFFLRLLYKGGERDCSDVDVVTNAAPSKPFRGPGGPQAFFAMEGTVDDYAFQVKKDPVAVRRVIDHNPVRLRLYDQVEQVALWRDRRPHGADTGRYRRGVGLASAVWFYFLTPWSQVRVDASRDGLTVSTGAQDMGNGTRSVLHAAVLAQVELPYEMIRVRVGESTDVPGPISAGSRTTASVWPAANQAALDLVDALTEAARDLGWKDAVGSRAGITHGGAVVPWADVLAAVPPTTVVARRPRDKGGYFLPITVSTVKLGEGLNGAVSVSEVEVDTRLGKVRALRNWTGVGTSKLISPRVARSQVEGAVTQNVSYALYEERRLCPRTGRLLTHNLEDYKLVGIGDQPEIEVHFDEQAFPGTDGPVGIAEVGGCAVAGSIANAVFDATGWRPRELPITPARVLAGVKA